MTDTSHAGTDPNTRPADRDEDPVSYTHLTLPTT